MSYDQIRNAFDRTATLSKRAADHAKSRLKAIATDQAPVKLKDGPLCVFQLVPIASISGVTSIDVVALQRTGYEKLMGPGWSGATPRLTLDGLLVYPGNLAKPTYGYSLVYRPGILESVRQYGEYTAVNREPPAELFPIIRRTDVAIYFRRMISLGAEFASHWKISGPAILSLAMLRVNNFQLGAQSVHLALEPAIADRPNIILPNLWIERVEDMAIQSVAQQALDIFWQSFGFERCDAFDDAIQVN